MKMSSITIVLMEFLFNLSSRTPESLCSMSYTQISQAELLSSQTDFHHPKLEKKIKCTLIKFLSFVAYGQSKVKLLQFFNFFCPIFSSLMQHFLAISSATILPYNPSILTAIYAHSRMLFPCHGVLLPNTHPNRHQRECFSPCC